MSEPRLLSKDELARISMDYPTSAIRGDIHVLLAHIAALKESLNTALKERDEALTAAERTAGALGEERAMRKGVERERDQHRQSAEMWRKRVEQAAEALADVLPGEVGRLDLLARIAELKRHRAEAMENIKRFKPSGQVAEDLELLMAVMGESEETLADSPSEPSAALSRLATKAQGYEAAIRERDEARGAMRLAASERDAAVADNAAQHRILVAVWRKVAAMHYEGLGLKEAIDADHPGAALLEQHRKAMARARNEGLEKAAMAQDKEASDLRRIGANQETKDARNAYEGEAIKASERAARIRAMKEPEQ